MILCGAVQFLLEKQGDCAEVAELHRFYPFTPSADEMVVVNRVRDLAEEVVELPVSSVESRKDIQFRQFLENAVCRLKTEILKPPLEKGPHFKRREVPPLRGEQLYDRLPSGSGPEVAHLESIDVVVGLHHPSRQMEFISIYLLINYQKAGNAVNPFSLWTFAVDKGSDF